MPTSYKEYLQACELLKEDSTGTDLLEALILSACDYSACVCIGSDEASMKNRLNEALDSLNKHCIKNYCFSPIKLDNKTDYNAFNIWIAELINTIFKNRTK